MLTEKFIVLNAYFGTKERSKTNNLSFQLRKLDKEKQIKHKESKRMEMINL